MNRQQSVAGINLNKGVLFGGVLALGSVIWLWNWAAFVLPFDGVAPQMLCAIAMGYVPFDPQPIYLWLGQLLGIVFEPEVGLQVLAFLSGLVGVAALIYWFLNMTKDMVQALVVGVLVVLFPLLMRQAVVQEAGTVVFACLVASLAVLASGYSWRYLVSGILFGLAVGVHPNALLTLLGFVFLLREQDSEDIKKWALGAGGVILIGWLWLFFLFRSSGIGGTWLGYMFGGVAEGYGALDPGALLTGLMRQISLHAQFFGWGGFVFGLLGFVLMAFQYRDRFLWALGYCVPFLVYQLPRVSGGDDGMFLAIWAPVYALGLGTTWREGSRYLAEGLQETVQTMLWITAAALIVIQVVCVRYTENSWGLALAHREAIGTRLQDLSVLGNQMQEHTQENDLIVVIPEAERPGLLGVAPSPWVAVWYTKRQVVWAEGTGKGWFFYTYPQANARTWQWMNQEIEVDDAFIAQHLRAGHRFLSPEPFPFLHAGKVKTWLSALPVPQFESGRMFQLLPGWPQVEDVAPVVAAYEKVFDAYVARGYSVDAAACLEGVIAYQPNDVETHRKLGDLYMKLGTFKRASEIYAKLLALTPQDDEVVVNLSGAYFSQDEVDKAIAVCESFLAQNPISPEVLFNLGGYYQTMGRNDEARQIYQAYLALGDLGEKQDDVRKILSAMEQE